MPIKNSNLVLKNRLETIENLYLEFKDQSEIWNDEVISDFDLLVLVVSFANRNDLTMYEAIRTIEFFSDMLGKESE